MTAETKILRTVWVERNGFTAKPVHYDKPEWQYSVTKLQNTVTPAFGIYLSAADLQALIDDGMIVNIA